MYNPKLNLPEQKNNRAFWSDQVLPLQICYDVQTKLPIELKQVSYLVKIQPGLAIVQISQTYFTEENKQQSELEYLYTIEQNSAVSQMIVELGDQRMFGLIKELEEARQQYKQGIEDGKTMVLNEQDSKILNIKRVKIGCLKSGVQLKILFEYIQPLQVFLNQFWKLELPPMINASFLTAYQLQGINKDYAQQYLSVMKLVNIQAFKFNYKQHITVIINIEEPLTYANSPTHLINVKQSNVKGQENQVIITPDEDTMLPTKKFELLFSSVNINKPHALLSHTNNDALQKIKYCATLTLIPKFNQYPIDDAYQSYLNGLNLPQQSKIQRGIYIFIIDRSGSMQYGRIKKAKQSLILFLKSLPEDSFFNIISFGSKAQKMFDISQSYNQQSLEQAIKQVQDMEADYGGTDIYNALQIAIYSDNYLMKKNSTETLNVFLLTDGEDSPERIIDLVLKNQKTETRIYTLGIGNGCSEYLVKKLADVGNGKCQLVGDDEEINSKVIDLLEDSLTCYLKGFQLTHNVENVSQIIPDPKSINLLKKNQELTIQILFSKKCKQENLEFKIDCYDPQTNKQIQFQTKLKLNQSQESEYFHKLAAHKLIGYYEKSIKFDEQQINMVKLDQKYITDKDIINLSIQNQILCSKTAFICEVCQNESNIKQLIKNKHVVVKNEENPRIQTSITQKIANFFQSFRSDQNLMQETVCMCANDQELEIDQNFNQYLIPQVNDNYQEISSVNDKEKQKKYELILSHIELIDCVQANGSFLLTQNIKDKLSLQQLTNKQNLQDYIWQTVISLFYLEIFCKSSQSQWQLIFNKAINYLFKQGVDYSIIKNESIQEFEGLFQKANI
ncbi:unnamed protein product [Paramecium sonneborni]|uniref:Uncharacterized protein n=1 Tax=Paramecium sonneborni TaxID=65129 RepID=A0A8S1P585_9CILI|nr:unnamed protein product [Paramecium sonneborni]